MSCIPVLISLALSLALVSSGICNSLPKCNLELEAEVGIEPTNEAFAEPCLTTWLPRHPSEQLRLLVASPQAKVFFWQLSWILVRHRVGTEVELSLMSGKLWLAEVDTDLVQKFERESY